MPWAPSAPRRPGTALADQQAFQPFWDTYNSIQSDFALGPVDQQTLVEGAIKGMIDSLGDPFSQYLSPDNFQNTLQGLSGTFTGIGAVIPATTVSTNATCTTLSVTCTLVVASVIQDAPADKAGLLPGDRIVSIDGLTPTGSVDDAVARIRGPKGTTVVLVVKRTGSAQPDLDLDRPGHRRPEGGRDTHAGRWNGRLHPPDRASATTRRATSRRR